ncbi:unnamed protein product [Dibothriocephalus latus]|uniref:Uncharacterized protein n=1 Tax=Dibothriocephalus latus TaxID=60516 RepID=A0A3P7L519_DIBLA|nr:unnamed protein product [Dibothriocephalus latus]
MQKEGPQDIRGVELGEILEAYEVGNEDELIAGKREALREWQTSNVKKAITRGKSVQREKCWTRLNERISKKRSLLHCSFSILKVTSRVQVRGTFVDIKTRESIIQVLGV